MCNFATLLESNGVLNCRDERVDEEVGWKNEEDEVDPANGLSNACA